MKWKIAITGFIAALSLSFACRVQADATVYWDFDNGFLPRTAVIGPGETVTWWNYDPYGFDVTVTFDNSFSFQLQDYHGQAVTFPATPGTYGYHSNWGDHGAVIVNLPPSGTITNPPDNAVLPAPATFIVAATATDTADDYGSDGQVFLGTSDSTNSIEDVFSEPFTTTVTDLAAGSYILIAVATDSYGAQATNAINFSVGSAAVSLSAPRIAAGQFLFDVIGLIFGKTNVLQASTDLSLWQPAQTNIAASTSMTITNPIVSGAPFYRILQLP